MTEQATNKILETGLLGAIVVILGFVIWYMYKRQNAQEEKHFQDMKTVWENDVKFREEIKILLSNLVELFKVEKK